MDTSNLLCLVAIVIAVVFVFLILQSRRESLDEEKHAKANEVERVERQNKLELENKLTSIIVVETDTGKILKCAKCGYVFYHEASVAAGNVSAQITAKHMPVSLPNGTYYCQQCRRQIVLASPDRNEVET